MVRLSSWTNPRYSFYGQSEKNKEQIMWTILFDKGILTAAVVLAIIGSTVKYRTGTSNELIALILTIISIITWSVIGAITSSSLGFFGVIWSYGIMRGVLSAGVAVFTWDLVHGTAKHCTCKECNPEEETRDV